MKEKKQTKTLDSHTYRYLNRADIADRTWAFGIDAIAVLIPMAVWNLVMLLVLGSVIPFVVLRFVNWIVAAGLIVTLVYYNTVVCPQFHGQTYGMKEYDLQIISSNCKKASKKQLIIREVVGFAIPFVVLMFFTSILGVIAYVILNGIVVLADKKHRSIIDFVSATYVVRVLEHEEEVEEPSNTFVENVGVEPKKAMELNTVDLHIHSNFSMNGKYNVEEIFQYASRHNMKTISITDLNTVKANAIAKHLSSLYNIEYVSGIELNADMQGLNVRILGYFVDASSTLFATIENLAILAEKHASIERCHLFEKFLKMPIQIDELLENNRFQRVTGDMIAHYVLNHPRYENCDLVKEYRKGIYVDPYKELAQDYFAMGKVCYVEAKHPPLIDVLEAITMSGGIAILANPYEVFKNHPDVFESILAMGVNGIEIYRPDYSEAQMVELMKWATARKLFFTCGSDFYDDQDHPIGYCNCPKQAEAIVENLITAMKPDKKD